MGVSFIWRRRSGGFRTLGFAPGIDLLQQIRLPDVSFAMIRLFFLLILASAIHAAPPYPPKIADARTEVYRAVGGVNLKMWVFGEKVDDQPKPAILFFFGGGWNAGSPAQFESLARHLAGRGMMTMLVDYRVKSRHGTAAAECVKDGKAALTWVRKNADRLGVDPKRIATAGGSAGGHVAASVGTLSGFGSNERPNALILFNPATTLAAIGEWQPSRAIASARLGVEKQEDLSPSHHVGKHTPPTLMMHGTKDTTVPIGSVEAFEQEMKKHKRPCKLVRYEGAGHGFFNRGKHRDETLQETDAFLVNLGWLPKP